MKLETFFEKFELFAEAPNGVQKLRELILQLAVMGKLVSQNYDDEPASVLLDKIKFEKDLLIEERKIKKYKQNSPVNLQEIPYNLPKNWEWTRLGNMGFINPRNEAEDNTTASFIPMNLIPQFYGESIKYETKEWIDIKQGFTHFADGDVVLAKITPCFQNKKSVVMRGLENAVGAGTTELHVFRPLNGLTCSEYVLIYLKSPNFINRGISKLTGTAGQKRVPSDYFSENPFPLPPLAEQHRIVAKVDQLMSLCDELEERQKKKRETRVLLNSVAINQLLTAREPDTFAKHWQRICNNFDLLYSAPENIGKLRQAILQLAVMGKLVPQDPNDEPASVLLKKIRFDKELLIQEGKIKKEKSSLSVEAEKIPFEVPTGWEWVRLETLCEVITKGSSPKWQGINYVSSGEGILFITSENVRNYYLDLDNSKYVEEKFNQIESRSILKINDILMNIVGASIGRTAIYNSDKIANINQAVCLIRILGQEKLINLNYLLHFFNSPICISFMFDKQVNNARANLSMGNIAKFLVPLPPYQEQNKIVQKVSKFITLCDQLETSLTQSQANSERLIDTAVRQLLVV